MPTPNRRYIYIALALLIAIWTWVALGRPGTGSLYSVLPPAAVKEDSTQATA